MKFLLLSIIVIIELISSTEAWSGCKPEITRLKHENIVVTGNFYKDAGSKNDWAVDEPLGLMKFDENECQYSVVVNGLKRNKSLDSKDNYLYKVNRSTFIFKLKYQTR
jgi:hypothetical protein